MLAAKRETILSLAAIPDLGGEGAPVITALRKGSQQNAGNTRES